MKPTRWAEKLSHHIRRTFLTGLVVLTPLWLTYRVLAFSVLSLDRMASPWVSGMVGSYLPGLGLLLLIVFLYLVGWLAQTIILRWVLNLWEALAHKIPLVGYAFEPLKQWIRTVTSESRFQLSRIVFIEYPRKGLKTLAFLTNQWDIQGERHYTIYVPTLPNPITGWLVLVKENEVYRTFLSLEEAAKIIFSGGILSPHLIAYEKMS